MHVSHPLPISSDLTDMDTELHLHVNHKNKLGLTETLGTLVFHLEQMSRYQPPTWYRLTKRHPTLTPHQATNGKDSGAADEKDRGQIQLEYQFPHTNKITSSVSSFSVNRIEKGE